MGVELTKLIINQSMFGMSGNKVNFIYSLDVDQEQGVSFEKMASLILGLGDLIQQANRILKITNDKELRVNILPIKAGSVEIELLIQTTLLAGVFLPQTQNQIKELLSLLGLIKDGSDSLIEWIRKFGGEKIPESFNQSLNFKQTQVRDLYNSPTINYLVNPVINNPLILQDVKSISSYIKGDLDTKNTINKDDLKALQQYTSQIPNEFNEAVIEKEVFLKFKRGSFGGEPDNWSFKLDNDIITATIKDTVFLSDVKSGFKRPSSVDKFKVLLKEIKKVEGDKTSFKYEILNVLEYEVGKKQDEVFDTHL